MSRSTPPGCATIVVPTVGRPSLGALLSVLLGGSAPAPAPPVVVVDDRPAGQRGRLQVGPAGAGVAAGRLQVLRSGGRGPAAARNVGWRYATTPWVAFLDDDVLPTPGWLEALHCDLQRVPWQAAASQGQVRVPLPPDRRPTDWERNVAGLEGARWITADMAYRREVLEEVGGFDERFPRAYREDADLGLRVTRAGYLILQGDRVCEHPARPAGPMVSVRLQRGNRDDALMRAVHGPGWRSAAGAGDARNGRHAATTAAGAAAVLAAAAGRRRLAAIAGAGWAAAWARFCAQRVAPGPRDPREVMTMAVTSALIPPAATAHLAAGWAAVPGLLADRSRAPLGMTRSPLALEPPSILRRYRHRARHPRADIGWTPEAVLFDRDGTLIVDVPGNTDPARVALMPGARVALRRARDAGLRVGVVTNQAAVGRGRVCLEQVEAINRRVEELLGPIDTWQICPHRPEDRCRCRKPAPGMVVAAATSLGVAPEACAVVGDIGSDVGAARAAGARSVLVPTRATRSEEIAAAAAVAPTVLAAVDLILAGMC
ncbi:HAD-IIIA family hydrolase [Acidiferrimicrobium sp. IK]|uniref:HAD-IIIA family hydrolase n=1 Tax=Acidiferrimicrobium sp. IK TaxID=2871700 RepID=UPI0021CB05FF|nr:HAD-IIIA family hydrolase [Acidiferrimicrobium sp. IK]MCU4183095.1 HAD-IIIA family hydrolase [Acidiferrimicrobium sp. IK]